MGAVVAVVYVRRFVVAQVPVWFFGDENHRVVEHTDYT